MPAQPRLFADTRSLFDPDELASRIDRFRDADIPLVGFRHLTTWSERLSGGEVTERNEVQLRPDFITDIFALLLGHRRLSDEGRIYNLRWEEAGQTHPSDATLGFYGVDHEETRAVIEMKGPGADLDRPQTGRADRLTPVDQAFRNATEFDGCRWVIVSNFTTIRLYSLRRGKTRYEEFDVAELAVDARQLAKFLILLGAPRFVSQGDGDSATDALAARTWRVQERVTEEFYNEYRTRRDDLLTTLVAQNATIDPESILKAAQQLLDRMLFIHFATDRHLLPSGTIQELLRLPDAESYRFDSSRLWAELRALFRAIDIGHPPSGIPGYNGGLFRPGQLDTLTLDEPGVGHQSVLRQILAWEGYDFRGTLDVDLLGHVFERSLADIENLRARLHNWGGVPVGEERLRLGVFYTPEWVTEYMVGRVLQEYWKTAPNEAIPTVLDPACGSGAFLTQALRRLVESSTHPAAEAELAAFAGVPLFEDPGVANATRAKSILRDAIFGVDLSPESTEITKLSLWLQTAHPAIPLLDLDSNIAMGNSLCSHEDHVQHRGFDWSTRFQALSDRGLDIVVGNPPWGADLSEYADCLEDSFDLATGQYDSYELFIERVLTLLSEPTAERPRSGIVALIIPDSLLLPQHEAARRLLAERHTILELIKLGEGVFENVYRSSLIIICRKGPAPEGHELVAATVRREDRTSITDVASNVNLDSLVQSRGIRIKQRRFVDDPHARFEITAGEDDYALMTRMRQAAFAWREIMDTGRGVEIGADGLVVRCPNCLEWANYPQKRAGAKGGGYYAKHCEHCGHEFRLEDAAERDRIIRQEIERFPMRAEGEALILAPNERWIATGESVERYRIRNLRVLTLGRTGINYKEPEEFRSPKLLFRKTGVGIWATIDYADLYTTQVVYHYRLKPQAIQAGYRLEYVLGVMNSRLMLYYYYKTSGNTEWKSFPYITQTTIEQMPVRAIDFHNTGERRFHDRIADMAGRMLQDPLVDRELDMEIERAVMDLYGLTGDERTRVFATLREVQGLRIIREMMA